MIKKVSTKEISIEKWRNKLRSADIRWLTMQYRGLKFLMDMFDKEIDAKSIALRKRYGDIIPDDMYRETLYKMEDEMMDMDIQLVDVEEELENRGVEIING